MKKDTLKTLIKEIISQMDELIGPKPELDQFKWDYEVQTHVKTPYAEYDRTDVSKTSPVLAATEEEAKEQATAAYNLKVVTIKNVKVFNRGPVTQSDIDKWKKSVKYYGHALRPKDQGGWGAD